MSSISVFFMFKLKNGSGDDPLYPACISAYI